MSGPSQIQIFINVRDRISDLRTLVAWLERAGQERIVLLDNDSTYPPLLEYLESTPHEVIHLGTNLGSRSLWKAGLYPEDESYVFSDPDLVPIDECPFDAVEYLRELAEGSWQRRAGLGLYLADVPESVQSLSWERSLVGLDRRVRPGVFDSLIDTTFAVYPPGRPRAWPSAALRTGFPYQCRHMPWYRLDDPTEEERFYLERAIQGPEGSSWAAGSQ